MFKELVRKILPGPVATTPFLKRAKAVREKNLTYLIFEKMQSINDCLAGIKTNNIPGNFLEFGIALGGSAICIASELDDNRRFLGFDVFGMIPAPGEQDGPIPHARYATIKSGKSKGLGGETYYGYIDNLRDLVIRHFSEFGLTVDGEKISLIQGLFNDTLPLLPEMQIAFAHIDCDWYDPVLYCLNYIAPRLSPGGIMVLDDYNDYEGCKKAADEFQAANPGYEFTRLRPHAVLTKHR